MLYTRLEQEAPTKKLTIKQRRQLVDDIQSLNKQQHSTIYCLVQIHYLKTNPTDTMLPYGMTKVKKDLRLDLTKLPAKLQNIVHLYVSKIQAGENLEWK